MFDVVSCNGARGENRLFDDVISNTAGDDGDGGVCAVVDTGVVGVDVDGVVVAVVLVDEVNPRIEG